MWILWLAVLLVIGRHDGRQMWLGRGEWPMLSRCQPLQPAAAHAGVMLNRDEKKNRAGLAGIEVRRGKKRGKVAKH